MNCIPNSLVSIERELDYEIEEFISNENNAIIDVRCEEGYCAFDLQLKSKYLQVYPYDIDVDIRIFCGKMDQLNSVFDRVSIVAKIDKNI